MIAFEKCKEMIRMSKTVEMFCLSSSFCLARADFIVQGVKFAWNEPEINLRVSDFVSFRSGFFKGRFL